MTEIAKFEKKGTQITITFDPEHGKAWLEVKGYRTTVTPKFDQDHKVWGYLAEYSKLGEILIGKKSNSLLISHESAKEAKRLVDEWNAMKTAEAKKAREAEKAALISGEKPIRVRYHDGEYLSGYMVFGQEAQLLVDLGMAREIEGWGYKVDDGLIKALGEEFIYPQAVEFARPAMEEKARKEAEKKAEIEAKFEEARRTGQKVEIRRWFVECDDPHEDCDIDIVVEYAMPDGSTEIEKYHTW